jgi:hypothetical protein
LFSLQKLPACDEAFDVGLGMVAGFHSAHSVPHPFGQPSAMQIGSLVKPASRSDDRLVLPIQA